MIAVAAIGGVLVVLTGGGKSTLALITPGLVALFAGVVLQPGRPDDGQDGRLPGDVARSAGHGGLGCTWRARPTSAA
jgi:hypothetical protein